MNRSIPFGLVASALALSGCSQLAIGASEPDEATQLIMETCGIQVVQADSGESSEEGDSEDSSGGYVRGEWGTGESWDAIEDGLPKLQALESDWQEYAISSKSAARLDDQWEPLAGYFSDNHAFLDRIVRYRSSTGRPSWEDFFALVPDVQDRINDYNANLNRIDVECGALLRTLDSAQ